MTRHGARDRGDAPSRGWPAWRRELAATVRLAVPLVGLQLGHIGIGTTDVIMMGWLGPAALAAGALTNHLYFVAFLFVLGVTSATAPLAAQALGARDFRGVRRTVRQGLWSAIILSLPAGLLLWYGEAILLLVGQEPALAADGGGYIRMLVWGFLPSMWFVVLRSFVSALSRPRPAVVAMLICVGLNVLFNYTLMFGNFGFPRLELVGAGISSSLVNTIMTLLLLAYILRDRRFRRFHILVRFWRPDWSRLRQIFRVGLPVGVMLVFESGMFTIAGIFMGWVGTLELAAHAIALQCTAVAFMVPLGIGQAGTVRVGLAAGARDKQGVGRAGWSAVVLTLLTTGCAAVLFLTIPETLIDFFLDLDDPTTAPVLRLAATLLLIAGVFHIADGVQVVLSHLLRGLNDTRTPMIISGFGYWGIGAGCGYLMTFTLGLGAPGIWYGLSLGLITVAVLMLHRFHRRERSGLLSRALASLG